MSSVIDVAIVGGGPGGLQAALVLARTRKKITVFDGPESPRNGASHGVHNVLGLDGMLPAEIRQQAWQQINVYKHAELNRCHVEHIDRHDGGFVLSTSEGDVTAKKVILATGFCDKHPEIKGFSDAWADTIIPCPFCDGYENRDRIWGIVTDSVDRAVHFSQIIENWTPNYKLILSNPDLQLEAKFEQKLEKRGVLIHKGNITEINQTDGKVKAVILGSGEKVEVETLLWIPERKKTVLESNLMKNLDIVLDDSGLIQVDENQETSLKGLFAVGDVARTIPSAMGAMEDGNKAAVAIIKGWYHHGVV